jgi:diguanylate cyclase (GGDEF)-like protein
MAENCMIDIVRLCYSINAKACSIYHEIANRSTNDELKIFWNSMAEEEESNVKTWRDLLQFAANDVLPQVFEDPEKTREELIEIERQVGKLQAQYASPDVSETFILAFRLELYLLHQALDTLRNLMQTISEKEKKEDHYNERISRFVDMLSRYGALTPELELLGETLHRLWRDNRNLALHGTLDELTGIYNRRGFFNAAKPLCHLAQRNNFNVSILIAGIDDFKDVNDGYGHMKGDQVLREVAHIIKSNVRASDVVARYGGDEFIILFSKADKEAIAMMAEKIRRLIEENMSNREVPVTVSIGIADGILGFNVDESVNSLLARADKCLYQAKGKGKNQVVVNGA